MRDKLTLAWRLGRPLLVAIVLGAAAAALAVAVRAPSAGARDAVASWHTSPVVGAWAGKVHGARYEDHLYLFHADGTMAGTNPQRVQEKPDGTGVNDSLAMGSWRIERGRVVGVFLELNANQTTHAPEATLKVVFSLEVHGDTLTGSARVYVGAERVPDATFELHRIVA